MAEWSELPLKYRLLMQTYRWRRIRPTPWTPLARPLSECRVALVTSAGLYRPTLDRDFGTHEGEDITVRWLPHEVAGMRLAVGQTSLSFDHAAIAADQELALPLRRLEELVASGLVGSVAPRHVSFNGSMLAPGRFIRVTAPEVADGLAADAVDAALFVPV